MGLFRVRGKVTGEGDRTEDVDLIVDTGATYLTLPADIARRLGLRLLREQPVVTAGGRRDIWPVAEVRIALEGREAPTVCFIAPDGPALLGAVALESLSLGVDPVARRLVPVDGFVVAGAERAYARSAISRILRNRSVRRRLASGSVETSTSATVRPYAG